MKQLFIYTSFLLFTTFVLAQSPENMGYQAVMRNADNSLIANTMIGVKISILQGSLSGTVVYAETQIPTTDVNGLVSMIIGEGVIISGVFAAIDWSNGPYFIKTETDPEGGSAYTIIGTSPLLSVPYALHAKTADSITGSSSSNNIQNQKTAAQAADFWINGDGLIDGKLYINGLQTLYVPDQTKFGSSLIIGTGGLNLSNDAPNSLWPASTSVNNGKQNTFVGIEAGRENTSGNQNTFVGTFAGNLNTIGDQNTYIGMYAGLNNSTGWHNTFVGAWSGQSNTTGSTNAFLGTDAGNQNTTGSANTFFGQVAGFYNTTGNGNTFFGAVSGTNSNADGNSFFGRSSGFNNTYGSYNTYIGNEAGYNDLQKVDAINSTAIGNGAFTTADNQVVIGNSNITENVLNNDLKLFTTGDSNKISFYSTGNGTNERARIQVQNDGLTYNTGELSIFTETVSGQLTEKARIRRNGNFGIGYSTGAEITDNKLAVNGSILATSIKKSGGLSTEYLKADGSTSTITNPITGTGTTNYIPKFTGASSLSNSSIIDTGNILLGTAVDNGVDKLQVNGAIKAREIRTDSGFGYGCGTNWTVGAINSNRFYIYSNPLGRDILKINPTTGTSIFTARAVVGTFTSADNGIDRLQVDGTLLATSIKKSGGIASEFLKADGSVDSNSYLTSAGTATNVSGIVTIANGGTGSATQNFVDLTTAQTIAGDKTFTGTTTGITKTMVGLGDVDNTSDANKPISTATQTALDVKVDKVTGERLINDLEIINLSNQSGTNTGDNATNTKYSGLETSKENLSNKQNSLATDGTAAKYPTVDAVNSGLATLDSNVVKLTGNQNVAGVKNFTDKITANELAVDGSILATSIKKSGGIASEFLKADGSVDSTTYLTSAGTATNVSGIVAIANGGTGSATQNFVDLTTAQTVAGNKTFTGTTTGITKSMVDLGNVDNTSDANKPISTATQIAIDLKVDKVTGERLINDSEIINLSNQSGTNTGDNATNTQYSGLETSKENLSNKQNSLATDGTAVKYPTVDAVNAGLATLDSNVVKLTGDQNVAGIKNFTDKLNANELAVNGNGFFNGTVKLNNLSGIGTRIVVADAIGNLTTDSTNYIKNQNGAAQSANMWITGAIKAKEIKTDSGFGYGCGTDWTVGAINSNRFYIYSNTLGKDILKINPITGTSIFTARTVVGTWRTVDNGVDRLQVDGTLLATTVKKSGGLADEILMADGSTQKINSFTRSGFAIKSTNYILAKEDKTIEVSSPSTITLPTAIAIVGQEYRIINTSTGEVLVKTTSSQTIGNKPTGNETAITLASGETLFVVSNGSIWRKL